MNINNNNLIFYFWHVLMCWWAQQERNGHLLKRKSVISSSAWKQIRFQNNNTATKNLNDKIIESDDIRKFGHLSGTKWLYCRIYIWFLWIMDDMIAAKSIGHYDTGLSNIVLDTLPLHQFNHFYFQFRSIWAHSQHVIDLYEWDWLSKRWNKIPNIEMRNKLKKKKFSCIATDW